MPPSVPYFSMNKMLPVLYPTLLRPGDWAVCRYRIGQVTNLYVRGDDAEVETMRFDTISSGIMVQGWPVFPLTLETLSLTTFFQQQLEYLRCLPLSGILNWHNVEHHIQQLFDNGCRAADAGTEAKNGVYRFVKDIAELLETTTHASVDGVRVVQAKIGV